MHPSESPLSEIRVTLVLAGKSAPCLTGGMTLVHAGMWNPDTLIFTVKVIVKLTFMIVWKWLEWQELVSFIIVFC